MNRREAGECASWLVGTLPNPESPASGSVLSIWILAATFFRSNSQCVLRRAFPVGCLWTAAAALISTWLEVRGRLHPGGQWERRHVQRPARDGSQDRAAVRRATSACVRLNRPKQSAKEYRKNWARLIQKIGACPGPDPGR